MPLTPRPTILTGEFTTDRIDVGETWTFEGRVETPVPLTSVQFGIYHSKPTEAAGPSIPVATLRIVGATFTVSNVNLTVPGMTMIERTNVMAPSGRSGVYAFYRLIRIMNAGDSFDFTLSKEYEEGDNARAWLDSSFPQYAGTACLPIDVFYEY